MHSFVYKGTKSTDLNVYVESKDVYSGAQRSLETVQIPGKSKDHIIDNERYDNIEVIYNCFMRGIEHGEFAERFKKIKNWLLINEGYAVLYDSYDPDYYRTGYYSGLVTVEDVLNYYGRFDVAFNCEAFKYSFSGAETIDITASKQLYNPEAYRSSPHIKVYGSGDIDLTITNSRGYKSWTFKNVSEYVEFNGSILNFYKGTVLKNSDVAGSGYPALEPELNSFSWSSNLDKIEIIPRWCTL